ncbi:MAG: glycosyltransferase family 2 protein [Bacteroidota bacterium]
MDISKIYKERFALEKEYLGTNKPVNKISPLVSVCIATYQHVNYIKDCLEGALMQKTDFDFEIILGEDESTDGTREICIEYAEKYPDKIRLFLRNRETSQLYDNKDNFICRFNGKWNRESAQGKYIAMCEGDDYWTDPLKLQKQVDFLEANPDFVVCSHNAKIVDQNGKLIQEKKLPKLNEDKIYSSTELKKGAFLLTLSIVFKNLPIFKNYPEESFKVLNGDTFLISLLGKFGKGYYMENIRPAVYRVHSGGIWSTKKNDKIFATQNKLKLFQALKQLHHNDDELVIYFETKITNAYRLLLRNLERLAFNEVLSVNKNYIIRHNFVRERYRIKELLKENLNYLKSKT